MPGSTPRLSQMTFSDSELAVTRCPDVIRSTVRAEAPRKSHRTAGHLEARGGEPFAVDAESLKAI